MILGPFEKRGWLYGMDMDLYKSWFLDGCPDGSGTKTKPYEHVSQIACLFVSFFWVLNVHIPLYLGSRRQSFFRTPKFFLFFSSCFNYINSYKFCELPNFYFWSLLNLRSVSLAMISLMWHGITLTLFPKFCYLDEKMVHYLEEKMYLGRWLFPRPTFFLWYLLVIILLCWIKLTLNHFHLSHSYMSNQFQQTVVYEFVQSKLALSSYELTHTKCSVVTYYTSYHIPIDIIIA